MFNREILIVDDNKNVLDVDIPNYLSRIENLKQEFPEWNNIKFNIKYLSNLDDAKNYMLDNNIIDVLVVDYNFDMNYSGIKNGTQFIEFVRSKVNKQCKIIFYTMKNLSDIKTDELISLINTDVYRMIDKAIDNDLIAKTIFDAATLCNPIVSSLERFLFQYYNMLKKANYFVNDDSFSLDELINHIRIDDETGRAFINKLLYKSILEETEI